MKISVSTSLKLNKIPSGSGIAKVGEHYYVVGDDSPYLFLLDKDFKTISKTLLIDTEYDAAHRIIKAEKPDFEALELIAANELIIFGSGSKIPHRDIFIHIILGNHPNLETYDITAFYQNLKDLPIFSDSELNIEATAFYDHRLFLFNRNKNLILAFQYADLLAYIKGEKAFSLPIIKHFALPRLNGIEAGFSGATSLKNQPKLLFTASVENTTNAYDDGEIMGRFIGMIDISEGTIDNIYEEFSNKTEDTLNNITNNILNGTYQHTDETTTKENGKDTCYRGYANKYNVLYKYHHKKGD